MMTVSSSLPSRSARPWETAELAEEWTEPDSTALREEAGKLYSSSPVNDPKLRKKASRKNIDNNVAEPPFNPVVAFDMMADRSIDFVYNNDNFNQEEERENNFINSHGTNNSGNEESEFRAGSGDDRSILYGSLSSSYHPVVQEGDDDLEEDRTATFYIKMGKGDYDAGEEEDQNGTTEEGKKQNQPIGLGKRYDDQTHSSQPAFLQYGRNGASNQTSSKALLSHSTSNHHHMQQAWRNSGMKDIFSPMTLEKLFLPPEVPLSEHQNNGGGPESDVTRSTAVNSTFASPETNTNFSSSPRSRESRGQKPSARASVKGRRRIIAPTKRREFNQPLLNASFLSSQSFMSQQSGMFLPPTNSSSTMQSNHASKGANVSSAPVTREAVQGRPPKAPMTANLIIQGGFNSMMSSDSNEDISNGGGNEYYGSSEGDKNHCDSVSSCASSFQNEQRQPQPQPQSPPIHPTPSKQLVLTNTNPSIRPFANSSTLNSSAFTAGDLTNVIPDIYGSNRKESHRLLEEKRNLMNQAIAMLNDSSAAHINRQESFNGGESHVSSTVPFHVRDPSSDFPTDIDDVESIPVSNQSTTSNNNNHILTGRHSSTLDGDADFNRKNAMRKTFLSVTMAKQRAKSSAQTASSGYPTDIDFLDLEDGEKGGRTSSANSNSSFAPKVQQQKPLHNVAKLIDEAFNLYESKDLLQFPEQENKENEPVGGYLSSSANSAKVPEADINLGISPGQTIEVRSKTELKNFSANKPTSVTNQRSNAERKILGESLWNIIDHNNNLSGSKKNEEHSLTLQDLQRTSQSESKIEPKTESKVDSKNESKNDSSIEVIEKNQDKIGLSHPKGYDLDYLELKRNILILEPNASAWFLLHCLDLSRCGPELRGTNGLNELCPQLSQLILNQNMLTELVDLPHNLTYLSARSNDLSSLDWLSDLPHLSVLDVSHNQIVSLEGLKRLSRPKRLSELYLDYNAIEDISILGQLSFDTLSVLSLKGNCIESLGSVCGQMKHNNRVVSLRSLDLSFNRIHQLTDLSSFAPNLKCLNLNQNESLSLLDCGSCSESLEELYISGTRIALLNLHSYSQLRIFSADNCTSLTLKELYNCPYLESFSFKSEIFNLRNIMSLDLNHLSASCLTFLDLSGNCLSEIQLKVIREHFMNLQSLILSNCGIKSWTTTNEEDPQSIASAKKLFRLDLSYNQLTSVRDLFKAGNNFEQLRHLNLSHNRLQCFSELVKNLLMITSTSNGTTSYQLLESLDLRGNPMNYDFYPTCSRNLYTRDDENEADDPCTTMEYHSYNPGASIRRMSVYVSAACDEDSAANTSTVRAMPNHVTGRRMRTFSEADERYLAKLSDNILVKRWIYRSFLIHLLTSHSSSNNGVNNGVGFCYLDGIKITDSEKRESSKRFKKLMLIKKSKTSGSNSKNDEIEKKRTDESDKKRNVESDKRKHNHREKPVEDKNRVESRKKESPTSDKVNSVKPPSSNSKCEQKEPELIKPYYEYDLKVMESKYGFDIQPSSNSNSNSNGGDVDGTIQKSTTSNFELHFGSERKRALKSANSPSKNPIKSNINVESVVVDDNGAINLPIFSAPPVAKLSSESFWIPVQADSSSSDLKLKDNVEAKSASELVIINPAIQQPKDQESNLKTDSKCCSNSSKRDILDALSRVKRMVQSARFD